MACCGGRSPCARRPAPDGRLLPTLSSGARHPAATCLPVACSCSAHAAAPAGGCRLHVRPVSAGPPNAGVAMPQRPVTLRRKKGRMNTCRRHPGRHRPLPRWCTGACGHAPVTAHRPLAREPHAPFKIRGGLDLLDQSRPWSPPQEVISATCGKRQSMPHGVACTIVPRGNLIREERRHARAGRAHRARRRFSGTQHHACNWQRGAHMVPSFSTLTCCARVSTYWWIFARRAAAGRGVRAHRPGLGAARPSP